MKLIVSCAWCGISIEKCPSKIKKHNFCSRDCLAAFSNKSQNPAAYRELKDFTKISKHMSALNEELNPIRMNFRTREKIRLSRLKTGGKTGYGKYYGQLEHRVVAEKMLGRQLVDGEVVHHIDANKRNNDPSNLQIFSSQKEHAKYHKKLSLFFEAGGDAQ